MRRLFRPAGLIAIAALSAACHDQSCQGRAPVYLIIDSVLVANGGTSSPTFLSGPLLSDVVTKGSIFNDLGSATVRISLKNIGTPTNALTPTSNNDVTITRYHVDYIRADGHNTPGVDVPFGFDGAVSVSVAGGQTVSFGFEIVRHDAKLESPLIELASNLAVINTLAKITFYGHDAVGNEISATASITVEFANFADPS